MTPTPSKLDKMTKGNNDANKPESEHFYNALRPNAERLAAVAKHLCDLVRFSGHHAPCDARGCISRASANLAFLMPSTLRVTITKEEYRMQRIIYSIPTSRFWAAKQPPFSGLAGSDGQRLYRRTVPVDWHRLSGRRGARVLVHGSDAGLLTLAGFEKPGYYRRQSFWAEEPVIHLTTVRQCDDCTAPWGETATDAYACEFACRFG